MPIFEQLRRSAIADEYLGVLTGSLVILPKGVVAKLAQVAEELHLDPDGFRPSDLLGCPEHVRIECRTGGTAHLVRLATAMFTSGDVRILVGTQSLLGEGWDAPALNSLVLASNTASFMLSNQMRGRAIRIDPAKSDKVANIWHLATVDPEDRESWDAVVSTFNWGFLNDGGMPGLSELDAVARRFKAFEGISNGTFTLALLWQILCDGPGEFFKTIAIAKIQAASDRCLSINTFQYYVDSNFRRAGGSS